MRYFILFALAVFMFSSLSYAAISISIPVDIPTKLQNGINITISDINFIYSDYTSHFYVMKVPALTNAGRFDKSNAASKVFISSLNTYLVSSQSLYKDADGRRMINYTASPSVSVNSLIGDTYLVEVITPNWQIGKWNASGILNFDPDITDCGTLVSNNTAYTLINNISSMVGNCIVIRSNNMTFDCNGYSIIGNSSVNSYGITDGTGIDNVSILNCNLYNWSRGISMGYGFTANITASNNTITSNYSGAVGIYLNNYGLNQIDSNYIYEMNTGSCIGISLPAFGTNITHNNITNISYQYIGTLGTSSHNATISGNILKGNMTCTNAIVANGALNLTIANNTIDSNCTYQLQLGNLNNATICNNTIIGGKTYGLRLLDTIYNNTFYNNLFNSTTNLFPTSSVNLWNITQTAGTNIIGGANIGGNYWANPSGTGYSQTCIDANFNGICDLQYNLSTNNIDYLPLDYPPPRFSVIVIAPSNLSWINATGQIFSANVSGEGWSYNCTLNINNTASGSASVMNNSIINITINRTLTTVNSGLSWNITCTNGSTTNSSVNLTLFVNPPQAGSYLICNAPSYTPTASTTTVITCQAIDNSTGNQITGANINCQAMATDFITSKQAASSMTERAGRIYTWALTVSNIPVNNCDWINCTSSIYGMDNGWGGIVCRERSEVLTTIEMNQLANANSTVNLTAANVWSYLNRTLNTTEFLTSLEQEQLLNVSLLNFTPTITVNASFNISFNNTYNQTSLMTDINSSINATYSTASAQVVNTSSDLVYKVVFALIAISLAVIAMLSNRTMLWLISGAMWMGLGLLLYPSSLILMVCCTGICLYLWIRSVVS